MDQRTLEWHQARLGHATGSRASDMLAGKDTQARKGYITQLVTERLTGQSQDFFTNADMQRGIEVEPIARAAYQASNELVVVLPWVPATAATGRPAMTCSATFSASAICSMSSGTTSRCL